MLSDHLLAYISQYALITNEMGKVLLIENIPRNTWGLPGGRIEESENWYDSLQREVKEESNMEITQATPFAAHLVSEMEFMKYCVFFAVKVKKLSGAKPDDPKNRKIAWVSKQKIAKLKFDSDEARGVVLNFLS